MIYLDNAATTQLDPLVFEAMTPYLQEQYGNPGSVHSLGRRAKEAVENARRKVAGFLNCDPSQIIFTSGGSEANNLAIRGIAKALEKTCRFGVVMSDSEHDSVRRAALTLPMRFEVESFWGPHIAQALRAGWFPDMDGDVGLVSVMFVNNETGMVNQVHELAEAAHEDGAVFHTDCVQAAACMPLDVKAIGCDLLSISSHKLHGPKGVGALYVKDPSMLTPLIIGGKEQEFGLRGGTENVAGIVGFGAACELYWQNTGMTMPVHVPNLSVVFWNKLEQELSKHWLQGILHLNDPNGAPMDAGRKIISLRFDDIDAESLVLMMDTLGVCISAGSACQSHESNPSHVLLAMGLTAKQARESVRVSFSKFNTVREAEEAGELMAKAVVLLRGAGGES